MACHRHYHGARPASKLCWVLLGVLWLPSVLMASPQNSSTRTLYVANNALDSATCGSSNKPCRSISRAIANARNGDRIIVRPGRYGDLNSDGIGVEILAARDVRVTGNIASDNQDSGFTFLGSRHTAKNNIATGNGQGFVFGFTEEGHKVQGNIATSNGNEGVFGHGFTIFGNDYSVVSNKAIGNDGNGFLLATTSNEDSVFKDNDTIGNRAAGLWVLQGEGPELHKNNLFGNLGEGLPPFFAAAPNCGLVNESGSTVDATFNFWGAPTGPGPNPADDAGPGSLCDRDGVTRVEPFETRPNRLELEPSMLDADAPAAQSENPESGDDNG